MSKMKWDQTGERRYETGIDHVGLYLLDSDGKYSNGVPWNGVTSVNETPSGADKNDLYADNIKYLTLLSAEDLGLTIGAYTYPDEFELCDGTAEPTPGVKIGQQARKVFGLSYRTKIGNDVDGTDHGYKLHLVYGCQASPSDRGYSTINDNPEAIEFSWEVSTIPVAVEGFKPTALLTVDSTAVPAAKLASLEEILYGSTDEEPRLPLPDEVIELLTEAAG